MQFDYTISKNGPKCKRLRECMKIKSNIKIDNVNVVNYFTLSKFLMGTCLLVVKT
jgi:hypothetical protein